MDLSKLLTTEQVYQDGDGQGVRSMFEDATSLYLTGTTPTAAADGDQWHKAVLLECMRAESCYVESDPAQTLTNLINWHVGMVKEADDAASETQAILARRYMELTCSTSAVAPLASSADTIDTPEFHKLLKQIGNWHSGYTPDEIINKAISHIGKAIAEARQQGWDMGYDAAMTETPVGKLLADRATPAAADSNLGA
jgi:hypothetical protein